MKKSRKTYVVDYQGNDGVRILQFECQYKDIFQKAIDDIKAEGLHIIKIWEY